MPVTRHGRPLRSNGGGATKFHPRAGGARTLRRIGDVFEAPRGRDIFVVGPMGDAHDRRAIEEMQRRKGRRRRWGAAAPTIS